MRARNNLQANAIGLGLAFVFMFLMPVFYPAQVLPAVLRPLAYVFPVTYGAHGIRSAILGAVGPGVWVDVLALAGFSVVGFAAVTLGLRWQDE